MATRIGILFAWNMMGFIIYAGIQINITNTKDLSLLNPLNIYYLWNVNYFGCGLLTLVFNALCPILTIGYWIFKFMHFICTVGRR